MMMIAPKTKQNNQVILRIQSEPMKNLLQLSYDDITKAL